MVNPEVASKKASEKYFIFSSKYKGKLANKHKIGHDKVVKIIVSFKLIVLAFFLKAKTRLIPIKSVITILCTKIIELLSLFRILNNKGIIILVPRIDIKRPNIKNMILMLNIT